MEDDEYIEGLDDPVEWKGEAHTRTKRLEPMKHPSGTQVMYDWAVRIQLSKSEYLLIVRALTHRLIDYEDRVLAERLGWTLVKSRNGSAITELKSSEITNAHAEENLERIEKENMPKLRELTRLRKTLDQPLEPGVEEVDLDSPEWTRYADAGYGSVGPEDD